MLFKKPERPVARVFLHCSASDNEQLAGSTLLKEITRWHLARNFATVGYHFLIDKTGLEIVGRNIERTPAAQEGQNLGTIAICVHGLDKDKFTDAALAACLHLCAEINLAYEGKVTFHGHCEVSAKTCPVFDYKALLRLDADGKMPLNKPKG